MELMKCGLRAVFTSSCLRRAVYVAQAAFTRMCWVRPLLQFLVLDLLSTATHSDLSGSDTFPAGIFSLPPLANNSANLRWDPWTLFRQAVAALQGETQCKAMGERFINTWRKSPVRLCADGTEGPSQLRRYKHYRVGLSLGMSVTYTDMHLTCTCMHMQQGTMGLTHVRTAPTVLHPSQLTVKACTLRAGGVGDVQCTAGMGRIVDPRSWQCVPQ